VSISSTFYARVFCQYPFAKKSQTRTFQLCNFLRQNFVQKCVRKTLMQLTTGQSFEKSKPLKELTGSSNPTPWSGQTFEKSKY